MNIFCYWRVEEKEDDFLLVAIPSSKYRPLEYLIKEWCMKVLTNSNDECGSATCYQDSNVFMWGCFI